MKIITLKKTKKEKRNLFYLRNIFKVSYIYNLKIYMFKFIKKNVCHKWSGDTCR